MWQFLDIKNFPSVTGDNINESSLLNMVMKCPQCSEDPHNLGGSIFIWSRPAVKELQLDEGSAQAQLPACQGNSGKEPHSFHFHAATNP